MKKAKIVFCDEGIWVVSPCHKDLILKEDKTEYPSIDCDLEKKPIQEIPGGKGFCDWCGEEVEVPALRIKTL